MKMKFYISQVTKFVISVDHLKVDKRVTHDIELAILSIFVILKQMSH
jgi:hypothetical protein